MPQAKKKPAKKAAAKRSAAQTPQVNRMTTQAEERTADDSQTVEQQVEETQAQLDAAGDARRDRVMTPGQKGKEPDQVYEPTHLELEAANFDHYGAEDKRQDELSAQRDEHNRRTGDASRP